MTAALELVDGGAGEARLDMQRVACLAEREASREPARPTDRFLDGAAVVDHRHVGLQVDLRLAVGAHAAERGPQLLVLERHRRDERVQWRLAWLQAIGMRR